MYMTTLKRIGFCCKWLNDPSECGGMKVNAVDRDLNGRSTTMRWLREHPAEAEQRQWDIMNHNTAAAVKMIERVATLPPNRRMVRLGSEMLQGYTEPSWIDWWQQTDVQNHLEKIFAPIGETARRLDVRLSFHPGQFCVLASENPGIVERSIQEFEYHADMARWMGYGKSFQDFKINVHISGKRGPQGLRDTYSKLSPEARSCITIENEENSWGLNDCISISDIVPIVLDIHHHWIREGEYINPGDERCKRVVDSWRGVRPALHYSCSREDVLTGHDATQAPDYAVLLEAGHKKQKLRAHSDFYWNHATTDWALGFWDQFDIQCESKGKNLASEQVYNRAVELGLVDDELSTLAAA
jgi:UV DNA damage repair endonuclease